MKVYFQNLSFCLRRKIKKVLNFALKVIEVNFSAFSVNIKIINSEEIKKLNKKFRQIDKVTDVLSFPYFDLKKGKNFDTKTLSKEINLEDGLICIGDIAICKELAIIQAENYGHSYKREVCFLALHGFLHLLGFDHREDSDEREMDEIVKKILSLSKVRK